MGAGRAPSIHPETGSLTRKGHLALQFVRVQCHVQTESTPTRGLQGLREQSVSERGPREAANLTSSPVWAEGHYGSESTAVCPLQLSSRTGLSPSRCTTSGNWFSDNHSLSFQRGLDNVISKVLSEDITELC